MEINKIEDAAIDSLLFANARHDMIPLTISMELTYKCNFRCIHCYITHEERLLKGELTLEEIKKALDWADETGIIEVCLTGGEIFLRKDLDEIIKYAREKRFIIRLKTNGSLITKEVAEKLKEYSVNFVDVSLYAFDEEGYKLITGSNGSFEKVLNAINFLKDCGIKTRIVFSMLNENVHYAKKIGDFIRAKSLKSIFQFDMSVANDGCTDSCNHSCTDSKVLIPAIKSFTGKERSDGTKDLLNGCRCNIGWGTLRISPFGEVYPCLGLNIKMGNIRQNSLKDIWERSPTILLIRSLNDFDDLKRCKECELKNFCSHCLNFRINCNHQIKKYAEVRREIVDKFGW